MKIIEFAIKGTEDYSKAQDKEIENFGKIENLLTNTISNIESGNTNVEPKEPITPTEADIGKYVNYVPKSTEYTAEARYSGYSSNQVFSQDASLKWKIWKVENDTLHLISEGLPSTGGYNNTGKLLLTDVQGYNNGVSLLDNICDANYGVSGNINIKAKNLKLEDVLEVKSDDKKPGTEYGVLRYSYSIPFPKIWYANEKGSLEVAERNRSTAYPYVEKDNSTVPSSTGVRYTCWSNNKMNTVAAWKNQEYYDMVMTPAQTNKYWLSSRLALPTGTTSASTSCYFGLHNINNLGITSELLYEHDQNSHILLSYRYLCIRPLISIPLINCEITENSSTANTFDIVIK